MTASTRARRFGFRNLALALALALVAAGCTVGQAGPGETQLPDGSASAPFPEGVDTVPPSDPPIVGEVPDEILLRIREDLAARLQGDVTGAVVVVAEQVVWPDGSLGCPQPGAFYTQALVPGYKVVLELDGKRYDYRSGRGGTVKLCEPRVPVSRQP